MHPVEDRLLIAKRCPAKLSEPRPAIQTPFIGLTIVSIDLW